MFASALELSVVQYLHPMRLFAIYDSLIAILNWFQIKATTVLKSFFTFLYYLFYKNIHTWSIFLKHTVNQSPISVFYTNIIVLNNQHLPF